jgi:hypothetical protein
MNLIGKPRDVDIPASITTHVAATEPQEDSRHQADIFKKSIRSSERLISLGIVITHITPTASSGNAPSFH